MSENIKTGRRDFLTTVAAAAAVLGSGLQILGAESKSEKGNLVTAPVLPYAFDALEPYISKKTVQTHFGEHHMEYYNIVHGYITGMLDKFKTSPLEEIIMKTKGGLHEMESLHYMSILLYNHNLYWPCMKPGGGGGKPGGRISKRIEKAFGSYPAFRSEFLEKALVLGSGWVTLVYFDGKISLERTTYHYSPLLKGRYPLLTLDVWEHAYYMDYQGDRKKYIELFLDKLINWEYCESRLDKFESQNK